MKFAQDAVMAATLPIRSLTEWIQVKRKLIRIAIIQKLELVLFSRNEVRINIYYLGDEEQLSLALAQADMRLRQDGGNWVLLVTGAVGRLRDQSGEQQQLFPRPRDQP